MDLNFGRLVVGPIDWPPAQASSPRSRITEMNMRTGFGGLTFALLATFVSPGAVQAADEPGKAVARPPNV
jgi:hypothetical protein